MLVIKTESGLVFCTLHIKRFLDATLCFLRHRVSREDATWRNNVQEDLFVILLLGKLGVCISVCGRTGVYILNGYMWPAHCTLHTPIQTMTHSQAYSHPRIHTHVYSIHTRVQEPVSDCLKAQGSLSTKGPQGYGCVCVFVNVSVCVGECVRLYLCVYVRVGVGVRV